MARYVLLSGVHADATGVFHPGDIVESKTALDERFPERFVGWTPEDENAELPQESEEDR